jgi:hypothetical protein
LHQHDTYEAFDLRSTNGTWEDGARVLRRRLGEELVTLSLSTGHPVMLRWQGNAPVPG